MLRSPLRRSLASTRFSIRTPVCRKYSTTPPKSSNTPIFVGLGAVVAAGGAYWMLTSSSPTAREGATAVKEGIQVAKAKANYVPKREDYQIVYNKIAELLDEAGEYDGTYLKHISLVM